mgnify:CR=1 FL=1
MSRGARTFADKRARVLDRNARALSGVVEDWLLRVARRESRLAGARVMARGPREALRKSAWDDDVLELSSLISRYGLRQLSDAGKAAASGVDGKWLVAPEIKDEYLAALEHKVVLIVEETRAQVNDSLRSLLREALKEKPRPSTGEIARRIARQWHGPAEGRESLFSFERAALIARTELVQAENAGIAEAYTQTGVEAVEWLANTDGKSGDRHHEEMNGETITVDAMRGSDRSEWFLTPLGNRMPYPGWSGAPVKEIANCRCMIVPARVAT